MIIVPKKIADQTHMHVPGPSCQSAEVRQNQPVPCGSARHLDFKKGESGAPAKVSWSAKCPCGALAGLLATERRGRYSPQLEFFQGRFLPRKNCKRRFCPERPLQCDDHFDLSHRFFGSPSERACQIRFRLSADNVRDIGTLYANKAVFDGNVPVFGTLSTPRENSCV